MSWSLILWPSSIDSFFGHMKDLFTHLDPNTCLPVNVPVELKISVVLAFVLNCQNTSFVNDL